MKPKEEAAELVEKYYPLSKVVIKWENAKQCALIAVDLILKATNIIGDEYKYWQQVRDEINKL